MQNNKITSFTKFMILLFLILTLMIAKSVNLIIFFTIFTLIVLILVNYSVKKYKELLKNIIIWLLFIGIIYIIIYGVGLNLLIVLYKTILILILIDVFFSITTFDQLNSALYTILSPIKILNKDVESMSFNLTLDIIFVKELLTFDNKIFEIQTLKNKYKLNIKNYLIPRLMYIVSYVKQIKENLILNFYVIKKERMNVKSILILNLFFMLFLLAFFKEVIM